MPVGHNISYWVYRHRPGYQVVPVNNLCSYYSIHELLPKMPIAYQYQGSSLLRHILSLHEFAHAKIRNLREIRNMLLPQGGDVSIFQRGFTVGDFKYK